MEQFPSNSHESKIEPVEKDQPESDKRVLRVVEGGVSRRKKTIGARFMETFFANADGTSVVSYVVQDILVPAAKDMIVEAFQTGLEKMIYGETRTPARRTTSRPGSAPTPYNRYHPTAKQYRPAETRPPMSRRARAMHNFEEVIIETKAEADEVISTMYDMLEKYGTVSVSDLYSMIGENVHHTDEKYGWVDLRGARAVYTRSGYLLDLPRPEPLD